MHSVIIRLPAIFFFENSFARYEKEGIMYFDLSNLILVEIQMY